MISLTETLAGELAGTGVSTSALCPTFFRTNIHEAARTSQPELRGQVEKLVTRSKWSAEQIAKIALDELERGTLYIVPQRDARGLWRAKRVLGARFYTLLGKASRDPRFLRYLGGA